MVRDQRFASNSIDSKPKKRKDDDLQPLDISFNLKLDNAKQSILVVEDEKPLCELLESYLSRLGYEVTAALNGADALDLTCEQSFDIYFLDLMLPGMDGFGLMKEIFAKSPDAYIVIMTAYGTLDNAMHAIREGAYEFVTKPFDLEVIGKIIQRISEHEQLKSERDFFIKQSDSDRQNNQYSRNYLINAIEMEIQKVSHHDSSVSLLLIQLANYSWLQEAFGNSHADRIHESLGKLLPYSIRSDDICARFDDKTFAVLLPQTHVENAEKIVQRLLEKIHADFEQPFPDFQQEIRIGMATTSNRETTVEKLIANACADLENSSKGKNQNLHESSSSLPFLIAKIKN